MKSILKYIGERFGKITILEHLQGKRVKYKCDCGIEKECDFYDVKRGKIVSCGCRRSSFETKESARKRAIEMQKKGILNIGGSYRIDMMTPFKYTWKCINNKPSRCSRGRKPVLLEIEDLETIWNRQNGMCPYSNFKLILPTHTNVKKHPQYFFASLDRKDSNLPYTLDNCQFISKSLNFAKNSLSHEEFETFLNLLIKNRTSFCTEDANRC